MQDFVCRRFYVFQIRMTLKKNNSTNLFFEKIFFNGPMLFSILYLYLTYGKKLIN